MCHWNTRFIVYMIITENAVGAFRRYLVVACWHKKATSWNNCCGVTNTSTLWKFTESWRPKVTVRIQRQNTTIRTGLKVTVFDVTPKSVWIRIAYIFRLAVPVKTGWIKRSFLFCSVLLKGLLRKYQRKGPWKPIVEPTYALTRILPSDWPTCTWQSNSLLRHKMFFFFQVWGQSPKNNSRKTSGSSVDDGRTYYYNHVYQYHHYLTDFSQFGRKNQLARCHGKKVIFVAKVFPFAT